MTEASSSYHAREALAPLARAGLGLAATRRALDMLLDKMAPLELAALAYDWDFWCRPKQRITPGPWRSWGFQCGRAFGKTAAVSNYFTGEVMGGRLSRIALIAQNEDKTREILVEGKSGLIATSPPWFKARWEASKSRVLWPNGAEAFVYSPEAPGGLRGPEHDGAWASELGAWPKATAEEALYNLNMGLRLGPAQLVWDTTPKKGSPIVRKLRDRTRDDPETHRLVRGSTFENKAFLPATFLADMVKEYAGTRLGQQELEGEDLDDVEGALFSEAVIHAHRRAAPPRFRRIVVSLDPAISTRKGTDQTGIIVAGLDTDGQIYVLEDCSGKHAADAWAVLAFELLAKWRPRAEEILILGETNRGGDLVEATLKAVRRSLGAPDFTFKGVHAKRGKDDRSEPVAALYVKGRVSHVRGVDLAKLEEQQTTWDPKSGESPDRLDALVHAVWELAALGRGEKEPVDYESELAESRMAREVDARRFEDVASDDDDDDESWSRY